LTRRKSATPWNGRLESGRYVAVLALATFLTATVPMTAADYSAIPAKLETIIRDEMREWGIAGVAVALVDDQRLVYAAGFGEAKRDSIFRCGSISKLFNALAVMQQVETGKLDLDAPLERYGEGLLPLNPFADRPPVTLRQLLSHRSGLQREAAVGGYLDGSEPSLAATVASVTSGVLATRPTEKTRYSNLGPSIAGHIVERVTGQSFPAYQADHVLAPLGMTDSAWTLAKAKRSRMVISHMRVADGHGGWTRRDTPLFDLGTIPAGNLYTTAPDLARFVSALAASGAGLVKPATLAGMWRPQFTTDTNGFGLGFMVGTHRGHRTIGHNGAVYGHSSSLVLLPEEKLGVVVLANEDIVNGRVHRISNAALDLLLEAARGEPPAAPVADAEAGKLADFTGDYESQSYWARLELRDGRLVGDLSGQRTKFTPIGALKFVADSHLEDATPVKFERDSDGRIASFTLGAQKYARVLAGQPALAADWRPFLGSYGPALIPIVISERHGHLYAMTENMVDYRLTPVNRNVWALPPGMYVDEHVVFLTGRSGRPQAINFANMVLARRR
jgi:serine beta-lactamase-like protein LACTB